MAKEYTQTVKPVSRIAERIFGWLGWLILLLITAGILFFSLVTMNDPATIDSVTSDMEQSLSQVDLQGADPQAVIDMSMSMLSSSWMLALYLALPLIVGILGLLNMKRRILAGILLLIAAILAAPFVVTLISSLFFVIAAILLFARKDLVLKNDDSNDMYARDDRQNYNDRNERIDRNDRNHYNDERELQDNKAYKREDEPVREQRQPVAPADDDVKVRQKDDNNYGYRDEDTVRDNDVESTRKFSRIDENDNSPVDKNVDSRNIDRPVTDDEYTRKNGVELDDEYGYNTEDPSKTRRDNVDRRNRNE